MSRKSNRHTQLKSKSKTRSRRGGFLDSLTALFSNKPAVSDASAPTAPSEPKKSSISFWPFSNSSSSSEPKNSSFSFWPFTALPEAPSVPSGPGQIPGRPSAPQTQPAQYQAQVQPGQQAPSQQPTPEQQLAQAPQQLTQAPQQLTQAPQQPVKPLVMGGRRRRRTYRKRK